MSWAYYSDPDRTIDDEPEFTGIIEKTKNPEVRRWCLPRQDRRGQFILPGFESLLLNLPVRQPTQRSKRMLRV